MSALSRESNKTYINLLFKTCIVLKECCYTMSQYYGFGLSLDTRDSNAYVSRAKRTRCYAETATFLRANFLERK